VRTKKDIDIEIEKCRDELANVKGTKTEVYTRIVGYYRNVDNFNKGKIAEYVDRREYDPSKVKER